MRHQGLRKFTLDISLKLVGQFGKTVSRGRLVDIDGDTEMPKIKSEKQRRLFGAVASGKSTKVKGLSVAQAKKALRKGGKRKKKK